MTMPILPALMGTEPGPVSLADVLNQLEPEMVTELIATAEAAGFGEPLPAEGEELEPPAEEELGDMAEATAEEFDGDAPPAAEGEELEEEDAAKVDEAVDAAEGGGGFDEILTWAESALTDLDAKFDQLKDLQAAAEGAVDDGADPDAIEPLMTQAEELIAAANEASEASKAAADSEDARTCALEALKIERACRVLEQLVAQASTFAETTTAPEATAADDPAMKLWAERTAPKAGPLY